MSSVFRPASMMFGPDSGRTFGSVRSTISNTCSIVTVPMAAYAELHCHTNFSFLDGASAPDELAERAVELGLTGLAITDHQGLYGVVRATTAYEEAGLRPILGIEVE